MHSATFGVYKLTILPGSAALCRLVLSVKSHWSVPVSGKQVRNKGNVRNLTCVQSVVGLIAEVGWHEYAGQ